VSAPPLRFRGTFGYGGRVYTAHEQERLLRVVPELKFKQPGEKVDEKEVGRIDNYWQTYESVDLTALYEAVPDIEFHVKGLDSLTGRDVLQWALQLATASEKPAPSQFNDHVNVTVPDIGLFKVKSVRVLESACTDDLQSFLDDGWMILAVCPQAARRPDYVLGTTQKDQGDRRR